jgi:hypothetical protein
MDRIHHIRHRMRGQLGTGPTREADMTNGAEAGSSGASAHRAGSGIPLPFCGDEYPPLKGSPGAVICTKACHPETQMHMNEETGWVWWDR